MEQETKGAGQKVQPVKTSSLQIERGSGKNIKQKKSRTSCKCVKCDETARHIYLSKLFPGGIVSKDNLKKPYDKEFEELDNRVCKKSVNATKMDLEEMEQYFNKTKEDDRYAVENEYLENLNRSGLL